MGVIKALASGNANAYVANSIVLAHTLWSALEAIPTLMMQEVGGEAWVLVMF